MRIFLELLWISCLSHLSFGKTIKNSEDNYTVFNNVEKIAKEKGRSWITENEWRKRCQDENILIASDIALFCYDKMTMPITNKR